jgi:SAM-dependent methyltransferase
MQLDIKEWHAQFRHQADWTRALRDFLFTRIGIDSRHRVLEVGSGTGAILRELSERGSHALFGLDINKEFIDFSAHTVPVAQLTLGDAHELPYKASVFDVTLCHFLLLWVLDPGKVIAEMRRVTKPGGAICLLAEPDYGGRIDYPDALVQLGVWQEQALINQGAETRIGRRLNSLLLSAGLAEFEAGILGAQWLIPHPDQEREQEWAMFQADLDYLPGEEEFPVLRELAISAEQRGDRILFVPTFYAWARIP